MGMYITEDTLRNEDILEIILKNKHARETLGKECNYLVVSKPVYSYLSRGVIRKYGGKEYSDIKLLYGLEVIVLDSDELIMVIG